MKNTTIELTEQEMECINGGDSILIIVAVIAGVIGIIKWFGGGNGEWTGGGTGYFGPEGSSISFSGTWDQFVNGAYRLFGLS